MRIDPQVFETPVALGEHVARAIADRIEESAASVRPFVLGCPGGRSALTTYHALAREVGSRDLDLSNVVVLMMDEYLVDDGAGGLRRVEESLPHSCVGFGRRQILEPMNAAAGPGRQLSERNYWWPDPKDPDEYERRIAGVGGVNVFLLASGASDGHIALNGVGTPLQRRTHVVRLLDSTRRDNLATFPTLSGLAAVPHFGITVGVGTIREHSHVVLMVAIGADKTRAVERLARAQMYEPDWPATVFTECSNPELLIDLAASGRLPAMS
jgi:glucosamine-6-phosphate deaminase